VLGIRVTRIKCEVKAEEMGGNGCIMWSLLICSACHILELTRNCGRMVWLYGMHGREEKLERNSEYLNELGHSESVCEFGKIILK
jgi:hypothetical protein